MASAKQTWFASFKKPFNESSSFQSNTTIITTHAHIYIQSHRINPFITLIFKRMPYITSHPLLFTVLRLWCVCSCVRTQLSLMYSWDEPIFYFPEICARDFMISRFLKGLKIKMLEFIYTYIRLTSQFSKFKSTKIMLDSRSKSRRDQANKQITNHEHFKLKRLTLIFVSNGKSITDIHGIEHIWWRFNSCRVCMICAFVYIYPSICIYVCLFVGLGPCVFSARMCVYILWTMKVWNCKYFGPKMNIEPKTRTCIRLAYTHTVNLM